MHMKTEETAGHVNKKRKIYTKTNKQSHIGICLAGFCVWLLVEWFRRQNSKNRPRKKKKKTHWDILVTLVNFFP